MPGLHAFPGPQAALRRMGHALCAAVLGCLPVSVNAQGGPAALPGPPEWAAQLPGYWASLISEDWRLRMVTPPKQEYVGIPINAAAAKIADAWDPARDAAQGLQCKAYGAALIMLRPETLQMSWPDTGTLKIQIDAGIQTRLFHFGAVAPADVKPDWQGYSVARWVARRTDAPFSSNARYLQVTTTRMLSGYLRQNGVPYSANAELSEDYDLMPVSDRELYLIVTTRVTDPTYLDAPFIMSANFQKQPDGQHWNPQPCSAE